MVFNRTQDVASDAEWGQLVVIGIGTYRWLACSDCLVEFFSGWLVDWFLDWCGGCLLDLRRVLWLYGRLMTGRDRKREAERERERERQSDNKLNNPQPVLQGVHWIRRLNTDPVAQESVSWLDTNLSSWNCSDCGARGAAGATKHYAL